MSMAFSAKIQTNTVRGQRQTNFCGSRRLWMMLLDWLSTIHQNFDRRKRGNAGTSRCRAAFRKTSSPHANQVAQKIESWL